MSVLSEVVLTKKQLCKAVEYYLNDALFQDEFTIKYMTQRNDECFVFGGDGDEEKSG